MNVCRYSNSALRPTTGLEGGEVENLPRKKLSEIVQHATRISRSTRRRVLKNPEDCRYVLEKACGSGYECEINVLITAHRNGIIKELQSLPASTNIEPSLRELTDQMVDRFALAKEAAQWAVYAWAEALKIDVPRAVFYCTWEVEVLGHANYDLENHWHTLGWTPGEVIIIPPDYVIGLRPKKMNSERFRSGLRYLQNKERVKYLDLSGTEY